MAKTEVDEKAVEAYLAVMRENLTVFREDNGACAACGGVGTCSRTRSAMNPLDLRAQIRSKLMDGRLPHEARVRMTIAPVSKQCAACDEVIAKYKRMRADGAA